MTTDRREALVEDIVQAELAMFLAVRNRGGVSPCQELPGTFRIMREMTHGVLALPFLEAYRDDLRKAAEAGRNLMTEKYALMEGLLQTKAQDPRIEDIVAVESTWRAEVAAQHPDVIGADGEEGFRRYLGCELQTYSPEALTAYADCVDSARHAGRNLVLERYDLLMRKLGRAPLQPGAPDRGECPGKGPDEGSGGGANGGADA